MKLATLCYLRADGKTLMMHRIKKANDMHQGKWNGLGGKLDPGETPEECVIREVREESGLTIIDPQLKGVLTFPMFANNEDWYAFVFVAMKFQGHLIDSNEGVLKWIEDEQLLDLDLWEGDRIFIPWLEQPGFFSGKFVYQDGKLIEHSAVFYDSPMENIAQYDTERVG
jgi:8-oxo-dGTP diphosphatase